MGYADSAALLVPGSPTVLRDSGSCGGCTACHVNFSKLSIK